MMHKRVARRIALALASVAQRRDSRGTIAASAAAFLVHARIGSARLPLGRLFTSAFSA